MKNTCTARLHKCGCAVASVTRTHRHPMGVWFSVNVPKDADLFGLGLMAQVTFILGRRSQAGHFLIEDERNTDSFLTRVVSLL